MTDDITRFRSLAELLFHPELRPYKNAVPAMLSDVAADTLRARCRSLVRHCWALLENTYGIARNHPFVIVYHTNKLCTLAVTADVQAAVRIASAWQGPTAYIAIVGLVSTSILTIRPDRTLEARCSLACTPESWLAMPLARVFALPDFLLSQPSEEREGRVFASDGGRLPAGERDLERAGVLDVPEVLLQRRADDRYQLPDHLGVETLDLGTHGF